jgi:hypothetical protein
VSIFRAILCFFRDPTSRGPCSATREKSRYCGGPTRTVRTKKMTRSPTAKHKARGLNTKRIVNIRIAQQRETERQPQQRETVLPGWSRKEPSCKLHRSSALQSGSLSPGVPLVGTGLGPGTGSTDTCVPRRYRSYTSDAFSLCGGLWTPTQCGSVTAT